MQPRAASISGSFPLLNELLTRHVGASVAAIAAIVFGVNFFSFVATVATSKNLVTVFGPVIGGDFVVFDAAATAAAQGEAAAIYDAAGFAARLREAFPGGGDMLLSWQYPPTMLLAILWLSALPYAAAFACWSAGGTALFFASIRKLIDGRLAFLAVLGAPALFQAFITGQTGFFSAGLIAIAALNARSRPRLAGLAAGLLTLKPQLGLLIPFVFAAAGCWRAFGAAAATSLLLAVAATAVFGTGLWSDFFAALIEHGARVQSAVFPAEKLVSIYGGAVMLGAPYKLAMTLQIAASLALAGFVASYWRRDENPERRLAVLGAATLLAAPNSAYYELTLTLPALLVAGSRGAREGFKEIDKPLIAFLWIAPMGAVSFGGAPGLPFGFLIALAAFILAAREGPAFARRGAA